MHFTTCAFCYSHSMDAVTSTTSAGIQSQKYIDDEVVDCDFHFELSSVFFSILCAEDSGFFNAFLLSV